MDPVLLEDENIEVNEKLLRELDKGLDDIEAGRFLSLEEGYDYVKRKRAEKRDARLASTGVVGSL